MKQTNIGVAANLTESQKGMSDTVFAPALHKSGPVSALVLVMLLAIGGSAAACPFAQLVRIADESTTSLRHEQRSVTHRDSTEGGQWDIYLRSNGTLHSIIRTDFGETGQLKIRVSFLTKDDFVIISTDIRYRSPLGTELPVRIEKTTSTLYFFCGKIVYIPTMIDDESSGAQSLLEAKRLKSDVFESNDIATYLKRLK